MIRYGSVCSGIEAASVAWKPLGWQAAFLSEIEKFPSAVLAHHHPEVPNRGDMTKYKDWPDDAIDLLVGGTPCQSFSIAGLRQGLADPRGNLMLTYLAIARRYQPRWLVWENVPGVLSSGKGRDFATFIRGLEELGYHAAWRVLDAQFVRVDGYGRAVPQRRRRVFVVGYLGDWRRAAAVLLEPEGMQGDSAPRREKGQGVAGTFKSGAGSGGWSNSIDHAAAGYMLPVGINFDGQSLTVRGNDGVAPTLDTGAEHHNRGIHIAFSACDYGNDAQFNKTPTLRVGSGAGKMGGGQQKAVAFTQNQAGDVLTGDVMHSLGTNQNSTGRNAANVAIGTWAVRRLTPTECERLQGFPDGYTNIPWRGKEASDGPRYKALGNSMAVNVMRWLGRRIEMVERLSEARAA